MKVKILILIVFLAFLMSLSAYAISDNDIEYAKNHLILLVHGIGDDVTCFDKVKTYLEDNDLRDYVYAYQFSDPFLNIEKEGWEFGDRNYFNPAPNMNGKCWLEKVKDDFKKSFKRNNGRDPLASEVPSKFIVIAHSMGGLSVRSYILGKDQNGNRYYANDIEKLITIDTPHKGSGAATYVNNTQELFPYFAGVSAGSLGLTFFYTLAGNDTLGRFYGTLFGYTFVSQTINSGFRSALNRYKTPALLDMIPNSDFLRSLNQYKLGSFDPVKYRLIGTEGIPTPWNIDEVGTFALGVNPIALMMASAGNILNNPKLDTFEGRFTGAYFTMASGYPIFENGDLTIDINSQMGYGVSTLSGAKRFVYKYRCPSIAAIENSALGVADYFLDFLPPPAKAAAYIAIGLSVVNSLTAQDNADSMEYIKGHITAKEKVVIEGNPNLLDQALFEESQPAGSSTKTAVKQIPLKLSSNLTNESGTIKALSTYHEVSPEALNEAPAGYKLGTPIVVGGEEKYIESFTVKEPPTRITGVLRDFMPLKMQYFQYSENFAAWKDIKILDEWGNFQIDGLKLAEGQNMIAFRAKNKVGYESNQHLKIIINTIPMLVSKMTPAPNSYTNNNKPTISGEFNKSVYTTGKDIGGAVPDITSAELHKDGKLYKNLIKDSNFKEENLKVNDYKTVGKFSYKPNQALPDGEYKVIVKAKSEVGTSQGVWSFWVDTEPPELEISFD